MDCKLVRDHLDAYVDGEIEPSPLLEFEQHLDACGDCRNEVTLMRAVVRGVQELQAPAAPLALRQRVVRVLDEKAPSEGRSPGRLILSGVLSTGAVAALVFGAFVRPQAPAQPGEQRADIADMPPFSMLGDIVARHTDELPADIHDQPPAMVDNWMRDKVRFRVRSVEFKEPRVQLIGGRVSNVRDLPAVKLYYRVGDVRLTSVVFQAPPSLHQVLSDAHAAQQWGAHRERIGSRTLTYRNVQGYTVPLIEHDGVVYAFTGDLEQHRLLQLVADARLP
jgi:anti-sigma factor (TIGR02949 family)